MKKSSRLIYLIFIVTVLVLIFTDQYLLNIRLEDQKSDAELINLSGRQRMYSQKIANQLLFIAHKTDKKTYNIESLRALTDEWKVAHQKLYLRNSELNNSKKLDSLFLISSNQLENMSEASLLFQQNQSDSILQFSIRTIAKLKTPFLFNMEAIVAEYQRLAEQKILKTKKILFWFLLFSVVILIAEFTIIIIPFLTKLQHKNVALEKANKQLESFAAITSHNLRAPVSNLNSLLQIYNSSDSLQDRETIFIKIETVIHHLTNTLGNLLEFLKIKNDKDVKIETIILNDVFENTMALLSDSIFQSSASIKADFSAATTVKFNNVYLESIFLNIIGNSIKFRANNRIPKIFIKSEPFKKKTKITFEDNGLGIDLKRHGNKLFGLNKTFHRHPESNGIGLYMTKIKVETLGGSIAAQSEVDKGSTFTIII
ncbi:ATP-binding protein [Aurantibacter sp.]|uniref:sensor histidine kinase n=1 Tax=Aurantibacter sp. TaxID=2807103 RepID=UPI00326560E5